MAITDVAEYAHLSAADVEALAVELDAIRLDIEDSLGTNDRAYIQRTIAVQRCLDLVARLVIGASRSRTGWALGTLALAAAKSIENMELGHNIGHGQWDWMNDPEIHSTTWEWDMAGLSSQWRYSHNYRHHMFTNVVGVDDDLGYGVLRVTRDQQWKPSNLLQPLRHLLLAVIFEWGIALHGLYSEQERAGLTPKNPLTPEPAPQNRPPGRQRLPALPRTRRAALAARPIRKHTRQPAANLWAYAVICCGHFVDGAEKFTPETLEGETKAQWYLRQMLGSANFRAGPMMAFMSGNLCYQIEHHLYPDLPSNRYAEIAERVQEVCANTTCPTPPARWFANTYWPCARSSNWLCRTGFCPPPPMTPPKPPPKRSLAATGDDRDE